MKNAQHIKWHNDIYALVEENCNICIYKKNSFIHTLDFVENLSIIVTKYNDYDNTYHVIHQLSLYEDELDMIKVDITNNIAEIVD